MKNKEDPAYKIVPRQVANKSSKGTLGKAIKMALAIESDAVRHNTQTFNQNRYKAVSEIEDYEILKDHAREIKEKAIANLPELLEELQKIVESRGGHFFLAKDGSEACDYVKQICEQHQAKLVVKAKSITTEEIKLNCVLEAAGIEVAETDLAEFIIQLSDEQPSHIIVPAAHRSRERISELFKQNFNTDHPLDTGEDLTKFARDILRKKFLTADVGISGANFIAADSGTILLVESEGNIRMVTQAPSVHIAIAGVEKIVPKRQDLAVFIELLAASATGQPLSSYTNVIKPPLNLPPFSFDGRSKKPREFHLVLLDNGRMKMRDDPELRPTLYCIRCSACLNSCANFQAVGGHAFGGESYSGGIGGAWEAGTGKLENARFVELCTGCCRCMPQCPVRIDIPWLNTVLRDRLNQTEGRRPPVQKRFFANFYYIAKMAARWVPLSNWFGGLYLNRILLEKSVGVDRRRRFPTLANQSLIKQFNIWTKKRPGKLTNDYKLDVKGKAVLFADVYTNYYHTNSGMATIKVLAKLGVDIGISRVLAEGRASLSQGMKTTASKRAKNVAYYLEKYIDDGMDIIVVEPSVLALLRLDYYNLLEDDRLFQKLKENSYDPVEYLLKIFDVNNITPDKVFDIAKTRGKKIFYHGHCQQKTIGAYQPIVNFLRNIGFDVAISNVECCGMAGSFGYKTDFYELSKRVGEDLLDQIKQSETTSGERILVASGISCRDQILSELKRSVFHPVELLEEILK